MIIKPNGFTMIKPNGLTKSEEKVMNSLCESVRDFLALKSSHPSHKNDFVRSIHECQRILMSRIVRRKYPRAY